MTAEDSMYGVIAAEAAISIQAETIHADWFTLDERVEAFKRKMAERAAEKVA